MKENKNNILLKVIEIVGRKAAEMTVNSRCMYIYHQPKIPDSLKKSKK